jgi:hypothetical protein
MEALNDVRSSSKEMPMRLQMQQAGGKPDKEDEKKAMNEENRNIVSLVNKLKNFSGRLHTDG